MRCATCGVVHRDGRRVRKIDLRRYKLAPRHNDFAHAVGLSNRHKRAGHPHTGNGSASDFAHFTKLNLGRHFATLAAVP
jgi:hypothetical protein